MATNSFLALLDYLTPLLPPETVIQGNVEDGTQFILAVKGPGSDYPQMACRVHLATQGSYSYKPDYQVKYQRFKVQPDYTTGMRAKSFAIANAEKAAQFAALAVTEWLRIQNDRRSAREAATKTLDPFQKFLESRSTFYGRYGYDQLRYGNLQGDPHWQATLTYNSGGTLSLTMTHLSGDTARLVVTAIAAAFEEPQDVPDLF